MYQSNYSIKDEKLSQPLSDDLIRKFMFYRYYSDMLFLRLMIAVRKDKTPFSEDDFLEKGQEFYTYIPEYAVDQYNLFKVTKRIDKPHYKKLVVELIEPAPAAAIQASQLSFTYKVKDGNATFSLNFDYTAASKAIDIVTKTVLKQFAKRFTALAENPEQHLEELRLISYMPYEKFDKRDFHQLPYEITVELPMAAEIEILKNIANTPEFIATLMPNVTIKKSDDNTIKNMQFDMKINNLKIGMPPQSVEQKLQFDIVKSGKKIHMVSEAGVHNLHQIGFSIEFAQNGDNQTTVKLRFHYNRSTAAGINSFIRPVTKFFGAPDTAKLLFLHAKTIFNTFCRHVVAGLSSGVEKNLLISEGLTSTLPFNK